MTGSDFERSELRAALGAGLVTAHGARVWLRTPMRDLGQPIQLEVFEGDGAEPLARGSVYVTDPEADGTVAFDLMSQLSDGPLAQRGALTPLRAYRVRAWCAEGELGELRFQTAPDTAETTPRKFSFAALSCHQPFDRAGRLIPASERMLRVGRRLLREHDAKFALLMGDQVYADEPRTFSLFEPEFFARTAGAAGISRASLFECTRAEARRLYHERYRRFWGVREFALLQGECACYPTLDDHEIADNFGSDVAHASPEWNAVRLGALDAFYDYQVSRVLPPSYAARPAPEFHYQFRYGSCAVFVMDLRSQRRFTAGRIEPYSTVQLNELERFLHQASDAKLVVLLISVPLMYVARWLSNSVSRLPGHASMGADRWNHEACIPARDRLLSVIREHQRLHPGQRLILLGGDIHVGSVFRLDWDDARDGLAPLYQFTSSAISNDPGRVLGWLQERLPSTATRLDLSTGISAKLRLLEPAKGAGRNPFGGLNMAIFDVHLGAAGAQIEFKLYTAETAPPRDARGDEEDRAALVFTSGRL